MRRLVLLVAMLAVGLLPLEALAAAERSNARITKIVKWVGPEREARSWGPVKATVWIKTVKENGKIVSQRISRVSILAPEDTPRSEVINDDARPLLISDTLSKQSADVAMISGATWTSEAYVDSLAVALRRAGFVKR